jgi:hypothetical protein
MLIFFIRFVISILLLRLLEFCDCFFAYNKVIEDKKIGLNLTISFLKEDNGMISS